MNVVVRRWARVELRVQKRAFLDEGLGHRTREVTNVPIGQEP